MTIKDLSSFANLKCLTLKRASILDTSFQGLTCLESLELIDCDFEADFKSTSSFRYVPNLEELIISNAVNLKDLNLDDELSELKLLKLTASQEIYELLDFQHDNLEKLELVFKDVDYFDAESMSGLSNLNSLSLASSNKESGCKIYLINLNYDCFYCLDSLEISNFQFPSFYCLILPEFCNLKSLSFSQCSTQHKINHAILFKKLRTLENLKINNFSDFFKGISSTAFDELQELTELDISLNKLNHINPGWFVNKPKLKYLSLNENTFMQLDDGVFSRLKNLDFLDISDNNNLRELKPQVFNGLKKLEYIDMRSLSENFRLDLDLFQAMPKLTQICMDERFKEMKAQLTQKYDSKMNISFGYN